MANRPADVIERLQRLRKIMTEEINLEKQVCKIKSKRDLDTNETLNRLSPIPQEQVNRPLKKSSRNTHTISRTKNETKYNYPQKTAPIRKKKSPELRKSSTQRLSSKEKTTVQTITEYRGSRSKSQTRSKNASQNRKMRNVEVQTGLNNSSSGRNYRETLSHSTESEKRIAAMHQDRLKRYFFGIWLRQRLRAARKNMDNTLRKRATTTYNDDQEFKQTKHKTKQEKDHNKYSRRNYEYIEYDYNDNINNPKATIRRKSASRKSEKTRNPSAQRKSSVSSNLRTRRYQTEYIIETDKCKTKVKRQPTNVLESEITRILEAKKQHIRVPSPIRSRTTISTTKTVKRTRRKPRKTGSDVPERQNLVTVSTNTSARKHYKDLISDNDDYDDPEVDKYIQEIRQQKLLEKFEEQRQKQIKTNAKTQYGYIPKSDLESEDENDKIFSKPKIPSRTQYNEIIDQIEEQQKNQIHINFYNNDSNSSSNSIKNIESDPESLSNIQKLQGQNHKSEDASSDILNLSFPEEKHATEINSFDVNNIRSNTTHSNQKIARVTNQESLEQRKKEQQKIKDQIEKMKQENYMFSSSDNSDTEEIENKNKMTIKNQQITKTTTAKIIKDEEKEIQNSETTMKKAQQDILDRMFNSDDMFSDKIEKIVKDEFSISSELAKGTNHFSSHSSSIVTTEISNTKQNKPLFKPENNKQILYVKTSKHILYENIEEEEEEDSGIEKYISDEYREIPAKSGNKKEDKIDYSDIEIDNEKLKKIGSSNILDDLSLNEENSTKVEINKKKESSQVTSIKISNEDFEIIEEEEEELEFIDSNQIISTSTLEEKNKLKLPPNEENKSSDGEKIFSSDIDFKLNEEEEEFEEKEKKTESNLMKEKINQSSEEIADLLFDHSSDTEKVDKQITNKENDSNIIDDFNESNENETSKENKTQKSDISDIELDKLLDDNNSEEEAEKKEDKTQKSGNSIEIDDFESENESDLKVKSNTQKSESNIDIDIDDFENEEEQNEDKDKTQKSESNIDIDIDDFENEEEQNEDKDKTQKSESNIDIDVDDFEDEEKSRFPFKTDFEIGVDELSSDNLEEKQKLEYELLPPTTLTEALGLSNETENQNATTSAKSKSQSDDDFISDILDENKDEKEKTATETKEKEKAETLSDMDIEIDDFNNDSQNDEVEQKKEKEAESGSDVDVFVDDFNENDESKEKESKTQKSDSDIDLDNLLDDNNSENEAEKKDDKKQSQPQKSDSGIDIDIDDFEDEEKSRFPFKTDFEIGVDELSSDNLEEKQKLEYELLPPTTLTEALGLSNETETQNVKNSYQKVITETVTTIKTTEIVTTTKTTTKNDLDEDIEDISVSFSDDEKEKEKKKDEESDIDIQIDDFQDSDDGNKNDKKSNSDINIDDISIHSDQEEQKKTDSDININDISIDSEKEEKKKTDSDIIEDDFAIQSDDNEGTVTKNTPSSNNQKSDFPFKTDYVVKVDDLSSNGIEERPKLDIFTHQNQQQKQQQQQHKVTIDSHSDHESDKDIEIEIDGDFEILSDDEENEQKNQKKSLNSNQVFANDSSRLNKGIDNIADDFEIESDNDIDIKDFQDNENDKTKEEENDHQSDAIDVVLDDGFSDDENKDQNNNHTNNDDEDIIMSDFEIDLDD